MVQSYRDLIVWQKAMELADRAFAISEFMPKSQRFVLCAQIERAAASLPANIAEGRSRHSERDFIYHLNVARGSLAELETLLLLAQRRGFVRENDLSTCFGLSEEITKMLHALKSSLSEQIDIKLAKT